jgi:V/A-type H+-transporting ATPase subunit E
MVEASMPDQLQHLLQRIRTEAVDQAEREAGVILENARQRAAKLVEEAEGQAKAALEKADRDARQYAERSSRALDQAGRDLLISVGNGVQKILGDVIESEASAALQGDFLEGILGRVISAYVEGGVEGEVQVLVGPEELEGLRAYFQAKLRDRLAGGGDVVLEEGMGAGFKVLFKEGHVAHDFSAGAIAEALGTLLQPHLAEVVRRAAQPASAGG